VNAGAHACLGVARWCSIARADK